MSNEPALRGHFSIDKATNMAVVTLAGSFQPEAIINLARNLCTDPEYQDGMKIFLDARRIDVSAANQNDLRLVGRGLQELASDRPARGKVACLVADSLGYGMARMFELLHEDMLPARMRTFRDHGLALQWLGKGTTVIGEG